MNNEMNINEVQGKSSHGSWHVSSSSSTSLVELLLIKLDKAEEATARR